MFKKEKNPHILTTDKEIIEALLKGEKIRKISSISVDYIMLEGDFIVDQNGKHATIYRLNKSDHYEIVTHLYDKKGEGNEK